jgi:hypothetical protein
MTVTQAIDNALVFLEAHGYLHGDIHDDLQQALVLLRRDKLCRNWVMPEREEA